MDNKHTKYIIGLFDEDKEHYPLQGQAYLKLNYYPKPTIDNESNIELRKDGYHKYPHHKMLCTFLYPYFELDATVYYPPKLKGITIKYWVFDYEDAVEQQVKLVGLSTEQVIFQSDYLHKPDDAIEQNAVKLTNIETLQVFKHTIYSQPLEDAVEQLKPTLINISTEQVFKRVEYIHLIEDAIEHDSVKLINITVETE